MGVLTPLFFTSFQKNTYNEVEAYSINKLPTTITLNDNPNSEIRSYYSSVDGLRGDNLLIKLKKVLSNNQKYYSYDSKNAIWQMYEIIDRDWARSPASEISGYNASTNIITDYIYGTSDSHPNDPYLHALYNNRDIDDQTTAWHSHEQTDPWGINQEHIWPKSHGFDTKGSDSSGGARGDPMHLWAGNGYANNIHSNDYYGYVDKTKSYKDCGTKFANVAGNYSGISKTVGSGTVFEPQDSDKGDIARAVFYMAARYNNIAGDDTTIDGNNPNLILDNNINLNTGTSSATNPFSLGVLTDLLEWNRIDPVDNFEIHRNNLLFNNYTFNRNPFIDFPQWAEIIWGNNPTGVAHPGSDAINDASISLDHQELEIIPGKAASLTATTINNTPVSWEVSDESVVTINRNSTASGEMVTLTAANKEGTAIVKAKTVIDEDTFEKECHITVAYPPVEEVIVSKTPTVDAINGEDTKFSVTTPDNSPISWAIEDETIAKLDKTTTNSGEEVTITPLKEGKTNLVLKTNAYGKAYERKIEITVNKSNKLDLKTIIVIAAVVLVILIIVIIILSVSSKARKKAKKMITNQVKKQVRKSTSSTTKKKTSSSKKK